MTEAAITHVRKPNWGRRMLGWTRRINLERRIAMMFLVKEAVESSLNVSQSYLQDHQQRIANDTLSIANEIRDQDWGGYVDLSRLDAFLDRQVELRDLSEAGIIDRRREILGRRGV